jgi:Raf kinase inhibitor-like YbhB/YbcL family protein
LKGSKGIYAILIFFFLFAIQNISGGEAMEITSAAFKDKGKIPIQYVMPGAGGKNISAPVTWKNVPAGTKSIALSIVDPHPVAQNWVHWLVVNIPKEVTVIEEGVSRRKLPLGSMELTNSFGDIGYGGPQPPKGTGDHPYVVTVYALNVEKLELGNSPTLSAFKKAIEGKVIESASMTGMYGR